MTQKKVSKKNSNPFKWPPFRRGHNPEYDDELVENPPVWIKKHPRDAERLRRSGKLAIIIRDYYDGEETK